MPDPQSPDPTRPTGSPSPGDTRSSRRRRRTVLAGLATVAVVAAAAVGAGVAVMHGDSSMSRYASLPDDITPRSLTCGTPYDKISNTAPSDPRTRLSVADVSVLRNDENGISIETKVEGLEQFLPMAQWETAPQRVAAVPSHSAALSFEIHYGADGSDEALLVMVFLDRTDDLEATILDEAAKHDNGYNTVARVGPDADTVTVRIPPEAMGPYSAGKRARITATLGEFVTPPAGQETVYYSSEQQCVDSVATAPPAGPAASDSTELMDNVDRLTALLTAHGLDVNVQVQSANGAGYGVAFLDAQGYPKEVCGILSGDGPYDTFAYAFGGFGNRTGFSMSQDDSWQWLADLVTIYCPEHLGKVPPSIPTAAASTGTDTGDSGWNGPTVVGLAPSPEFPTSIPQWRLEDTWHTTPRAFTGSSWTTAAGPEHAPFPASQNGCNSARFLVRWRATAEDSMVEATAMGYGIKPGETVVGQAGWMDLNGCEEPAFRLQGRSDGSTLTDVTVSVQRWFPAP